MSSIFWKNIHLCFSKMKCKPEAASKQDHSRPSPIHLASSTLMMTSFNSLYDLAWDSTATSKPLTYSTDHSSSSDESEADSPPDLATIFASQRFFFSSPGRSNSIIPESRGLVTGGVAVQTYSPDPFSDFRRSMQEMVESRGLMDVQGNWDELHELLLCYLNLNPRHAHRFIVSAFADLLVSLVSSSTAIDVTSSHRKPSGCHGRGV